MTIAWALSGGGAKGDFEVGAARCLQDLNLVPSIVSSTSVGSVNALKIAEGPQGMHALEAVWLSLRGSGDMFAREAWTTDPDVEDNVLKAAQSLIAPPMSFPELSVFDGVQLLDQAIEFREPVTGGYDPISKSAIAATSGFLPIIGFLVASEIGKLEKLVTQLGEQQSIFNLKPTVELVRANINQGAIAAWGAQGNRLRLAMVGLASGALRYLTETGRVVERDGVTPAYDRETGFEVYSTYLTGMLASSSIPAVFPPVVIRDDAYVDGGVRQVIPIEVAVLLGANQVFAIHASKRDVDLVPRLKTAKLLEIALRSLMEITINEIAYSDTFRTGSWGPNVEVKVIQPRLDIHDSFTIYPAFVRNRMVYGYLCAADVVNPAAAEGARCQEIADQISRLRYAAARLEAWLEGRPVPPTLAILDPPREPSRSKVRQTIFQLKLSVRALVQERARLGGMMPPSDGSWADPQRWWSGWERHPLRQDIAPQNGEVFATSNAANHMDLFFVAENQHVLQASWNPESRESWEGWYQVAEGESMPGSPIFGASRHTGSTDLVIAGTDGAIWTAQWDRQFIEDDTWTGWHNWQPLQDGRTSQRGAVTVTSRRPEILDAFVAGTDGRIYTAGSGPDRRWAGWWQIGGLITSAGAPVHAVSKALDNLDIFATDSNGDIQWSHWDPTLAGGWTAWTALLGGRATPGGPVTAVSRATDLIDVFVVGTDRGIWTAALDQQGWRGWSRVGTITAPDGSTVSVVSHGPDQLDIFVTTEQGNIRWSHWDPNLTSWTAWAGINGGRAAPGSTIAATSRGLGLIDLFVIGLDGSVWSADFALGAGWAGWWRLNETLKDNPMDPTLVTGSI